MARTFGFRHTHRMRETSPESESQATWRELLQTIRGRQTELMRQRPWRDSGLVPNPSGRSGQLDAVETRLGHALPPSYRAFLSDHDGWPRFYEGAALLGSKDLGREKHLDLVAQTFESCFPPSENAVAKASSKPRLLPFGIDSAGTTLFAFDLDSQRDDGECEVVAWLNEVGVRRSDFSSFLRLVLELCEAELAELRRERRATEVEESDSSELLAVAAIA
ncbi:MAG: SMI1/KNR4 family protein [Polyangiaceae bacterium]